MDATLALFSEMREYSNMVSPNLFPFKYAVADTTAISTISMEKPEATLVPILMFDSIMIEVLQPQTQDFVVNSWEI
ncbi:hypothetical protein [Oleispirillum naphthae]|uniref:hypothetical protein n=1 Tax=Oleispirillum naphthae TaxID=2838853 RepID=UPI0030822E26